jgi:hypothetical protein
MIIMLVRTEWGYERSWISNNPDSNSQQNIIANTYSYAMAA